MARLATLAFPLAAALLAREAAAAERQAFRVVEIPSSGRTVAAAVADLDGDGRADLWTASFTGVPPDERRELHVRWQREGGGFVAAPDLVLPLPGDAAAYDLARLSGGPPQELLFLRRERVSVLSLRGRKPTWRAIELGAPTIGVAPDERGLDRLALVRQGLGSGPRLIVPGLGELFVALPSGELAARLRLGGRANYFIPPRPGPNLGENELEIYFDQPRVELADADGDGLADVIATDRHAVRVFRQRPGGALPARPDRTLALRRISEKDHVRGSGSVRTAVTDLDADGRADLVVTHVAEGLLAARSDTTLHRNRGGSWNLSEPDQTFSVKGGFSTEELVDLDGDGRVELVSVRIPLGVLELVEMLVTRSVDVHVAVRRAGRTTPFASAPSFERKLSVPFSMETFRPRGFVGNVASDWNDDGLRDLVLSGDGHAVEIHLGAPERPFATRATRQELDTEGSLVAADLDGDRLQDFVIFDPRRTGAPIRLGFNLGTLPGTPARGELRPVDQSSRGFGSGRRPSLGLSPTRTASSRVVVGE
jgi:hypothetical protein